MPRPDSATTQVGESGSLLAIVNVPSLAPSDPGVNVTGRLTLEKGCTVKLEAVVAKVGESTFTEDTVSNVLPLLRTDSESVWLCPRRICPNVSVVATGSYLSTTVCRLIGQIGLTSVVLVTVTSMTLSAAIEASVETPSVPVTESG